MDNGLNEGVFTKRKMMIGAFMDVTQPVVLAIYVVE